MKKLITLIFAIIIAFPIIAGTKLISGDLSKLPGAKAIPVFVNWDNAVYGNSGALADFLSTSIRDDNWEKVSLDYLLTRTNAQTVEYGVRLTSSQDTTSYKYKMEILVQSISKDGTIQGIINIISIDPSETIASIEFKSDDADNNDKIAFRDQFKSLGKSLGKLMTSQFKNNKDIKTESSKKRRERPADDYDPLYN